MACWVVPGDDRPKRAPSHSGEARDRRRTPSSGVKIVAEEPHSAPPLARTPTPQDHLSRRLTAVEQELKDNTRSTVRMEALLESFLGPQVKDLTAKLDTCLHHIAASSHIAANVIALGEKLDGGLARLGAIERAQGEAAVRFEEHDERDQKIEQRVERIEVSSAAVEQKLAIADNTAKVRRLVAAPRWWRAAWVKAIGVAVAGAITAATAYHFGG